MLSYHFDMFCYRLLFWESRHCYCRYKCHDHSLRTMLYLGQREDNGDRTKFHDPLKTTRFFHVHHDVCYSILSHKVWVLKASSGVCGQAQTSRSGELNVFHVGSVPVPKMSPCHDGAADSSVQCPRAPKHLHSSSICCITMSSQVSFVSKSEIKTDLGNWWTSHQTTFFLLKKSEIIWLCHVLVTCYCYSEDNGKEDILD